MSRALLGIGRPLLFLNHHTLHKKWYMRRCRSPVPLATIVNKGRLHIYQFHQTLVRRNVVMMGIFVRPAPQHQKVVERARPDIFVLRPSWPLDVPAATTARVLRTSFRASARPGRLMDWKACRIARCALPAMCVRAGHEPNQSGAPRATSVTRWASPSPS